MRKRFWFVSGLVLAEMALCAAIVAVLWNSVGWLGASGVRLNAFEVDRFTAQATEEQRLAVGGPATLSVDNAVGDVTVQAGAADEVVVTAAKFAFGPSQAEADARLAELQVQVTQTGDTIRVVVVQPEEVTLIGSNRSDYVDFTVLVPAQTHVSVDTGYGDLTASGTTGDLSLATSAGTVTARDIAGSLDLRSDYGDVVVEDAVAETVAVHSSSGRLSLTRVQAGGAVDVHSDYGGITLSQGTAASLAVSSSSGNIELTGLDVDGLAAVSTDYGGLQLEQVLAGAYDLETSSGDVTLTGGSGAIKAHTDYGNIAVSGLGEASLDLHSSSGSVVFAGALGAGPHSVTSDYGEIRLTLPAGTAVDFDLQTDYGRIQSEFPVTLNGNTELDEDHWRGSLNGGGDSLTVHTSSGNIGLFQAQS